MPVSVEWYNDQHTIIHHLYEGAWTWEELYHNLHITSFLLEDVDHRVDLISELRNANAMPSGAFSPYFRAVATFMEHPKIGTTVVVNASFGQRTFIEIFNQIYRRHAVTMTSTLEEAHAIVTEHQRNRQQDQ